MKILILLFLIQSVAFAGERDCLAEAIRLEYHRNSLSTWSSELILEMKPKHICESANNHFGKDAYEYMDYDKAKHEKHFTKKGTFKREDFIFHHDTKLSAEISKEDLCEFVDAEIEDLSECALPAEKISAFVKRPFTYEEVEKTCLEQMVWLDPLTKRCRAAELEAAERESK